MTATPEQVLAKLGLLEHRVEALEKALGQEPKPKTEPDELAAAFRAGAETARKMFPEERSA